VVVNAILLSVETDDPRALERLVRPLGAVVIEDEDDTYVRVGLDTYQVLCYTGEARLVIQAIAFQGRGRVVGECEIVDD
jgi:hypothetical protein